MNNIQFADDKSLVSPRYWCTSRFWQIPTYELQPRYYTIVDKLHNACVSIIDMMLYLLQQSTCLNVLCPFLYVDIVLLCTCNATFMFVSSSLLEQVSKNGSNIGINR